MFVFSYGVIVFWNFTEPQEKDILADLTFATSSTFSSAPLPPLSRDDLQLALKGTRSGNGLIVRPIAEQDIETEEFQFEYSKRSRSPRIYNDIITLRSDDHMVKLTMSHAISQSTKLSFFESKMEQTMLEIESVPKALALTGQLEIIVREDVMKLEGRLFKLRVDVNLSSNVLDIPDFFWEDEPNLHPLYSAVREYLEIKQRILVLNERCKVFLDLADIVADSIAEANMSRITWIIIWLIVLSLMVSMLEIVFRFSVLSKMPKCEAAP
ncbi:uncharacterized protein V1510DRAFT_420889 [Dipodascopsis tothii]|uniref:uncharacterized protein n=1 Tax=Dipodascopsis tothii TaxID=44089 RepID=UPI0034D00A4E